MELCSQTYSYIGPILGLPARAMAHPQQFVTSKKRAETNDALSQVPLFQKPSPQFGLPVPKKRVHQILAHHIASLSEAAACTVCTRKARIDRSLPLCPLRPAAEEAVLPPTRVESFDDPRPCVRRPKSRRVSPSSSSSSPTNSRTSTAILLLLLLHSRLSLSSTTGRG